MFCCSRFCIVTRRLLVLVRIFACLCHRCGHFSISPSSRSWCPSEGLSRFGGLFTPGGVRCI